MARNGTRAGAARETDPSPTVANSADGLEPLKAWFGRSLWAAQGLAGWLQELHREGALAATGWAETLAMGAREMEQADGVERLLAVPSHMLSREIEAGLRRYADAAQRLLDSELRLMDGWREQGMAAMRSALPSARQPLDGNGSLPWLEPWTRAMNDLQSLTQRWADSVDTAKR